MDTIFNDNPIDYNFNGMFFIFLELDIISHFHHFAIDTNTDISFFFKLFYRFHMLPFASGNNWSQDLYFCAFRIFHYPIDHLLDSLRSNFYSMFWTSWMPYPCK